MGKKSIRIIYLFLLIVILIVPLTPLNKVGANAELHGTRGVAKLNFPGNPSSSQDGTITLPNKSFLVGSSIDTGYLSYTQESMYRYRVYVNGGNITRPVYNPKKYSMYSSTTRTYYSPSIPSSVSSTDYGTYGTYTGTLYSSGGARVVGGQLIPAVSKYASAGGGSYTYGPWCKTGVNDTIEYKSPPSLPGTMSYNSGGYSGTLTLKQNSGTHPNPFGQCGTQTIGPRYAMTYYYAGTVWTQEVDTRVFEQYYSGTLYAPGYDDYYMYNVGLEYEYDFEAPIITTNLSKETPTNQDVQIYTNIVDTGSGVSKSYWVEGEYTVSQMRSKSGKSLQNTNDFINVEENGIFTIYSVDKVGNDRVVVVEITNIDKTEPIINVYGDFITWTNKDLPVQAQVSYKQTWKEIVHYKMLPGNMGLGSFSTDGKIALDGKYTLPSNGYYTFYVRDTADNEAIRLLRVTNIDKVRPKLDITYDDSPTSEDVTVYTNAVDHESGIKVLKWYQGDVSGDIVKNQGNTMFGKTFKATDNGYYTVYVEDLAGNISLGKIHITNIDRRIPNKPEFTETGTKTQKDLEIKYDNRYTSHWYRYQNSKETTGWIEYTGNLTFTENTLVEAITYSTTGVSSEKGIHYVVVEHSENGGETGEENDGEHPGLEYPDHRVPIHQTDLTDLGVNGNKRAFKIKLDSDLFFVSKNTGYIEGYPYSEHIKEYYRKGISLPSKSSILTDVFSMLEKNYKDYTLNDYKDDIMYKDEVLTSSKHRRYYLPLRGDTKLEKNKQYSNVIALRNLGLNDFTVEYLQHFEFDNYLLGDDYSKVVFMEQEDTKIDMYKDPTKVNSISITNSQVLEIQRMEKERKDNKRISVYRYTDRNFMDRLNNILQGK